MIKSAQPRGIVIYRGPSMLDGKPIVVIATLETTNEKTGDMIQTWILREDVKPTEAINTGDDSSVCGDCPLRGIIESGRNRMRACYVTVRNAPRMVWESYHRGIYPEYCPEEHDRFFIGRKLRMGAYGDPVAMPYMAWKPFVAMANGRTGYSHSWRIKRFWRFRRWLMASVETHTDAMLAKERGWRYFRTLSAVSDLASGEILCPASDEAGKRRQCETCLACNGSNGNPQRVSVAIVAHGSKATVSSYHKITS